MNKSTINDLEGRMSLQVNDKSITNMVRRCLALRNKPINALVVEELRLLVSQGMGLKLILPIVFEKLINEPFLEGDFYEGDLLYSVLNVGIEYWREFPDQYEQFQVICKKAQEGLTQIDTTDDIRNKLSQSLFEFLTLF